MLVERAGRIGTLTLNRPEKLNAFFGTMREEIADGLESLADDESIRVIVVTGAGRAFCAGDGHILNGSREMAVRWP